MIAIVSVRQTADKPNFPLRPLAVFTGSSMTLGVVDVPPTREGIAVTGVSLAVENAVGAVVSASAVESGGVWTATIPASHFAAVGVVTMGVTISASGTDENGAARSWIVGKGDLTILPADGVPVPGETLQNVHLRDSVPETPAKGDLCEGANGWQIYTGDAWAVIAPDLSNYASKADATLAERTGEEWQYGELTVSDDPDAWVWTYEYPQYDNGTWTTEITNGPDFIAMTATGPEDATSLSFTGSGSGITASGTITRTVLRGYQLGSQWSKPLASEAEAEALRTGKQDVLTWDNSPTYNSQKPVKSGGIWSAIWGALSALPTGFTSLYDWCVSQLSGKVSTSGGTMTGALTVNYSPGMVGQAFTKLFDDKLHVGSATAKAEYKYDRITRTVGGGSVDLDFPFESGTLALTSGLPPSETWTFEVDDGQGGTTTITKNVAIYAGANA